jgi:hypothetical protein
MQAVTLSENAVAVLRLRVKGLKLPVNETRLKAYRELAAAGIMAPVSGNDGAPEADYGFTEDGWVRREAILDAAEAHLRSLEPRLPERIELSRAARKTVARHLAGDRNVTDVNREAYRELARAGIMYPVSTFAGGPESLFRFTSRGWERRHEFHRPLPRLSASAIARSLSLAVSRIARGVSAAR